MPAASFAVYGLPSFSFVTATTDTGWPTDVGMVDEEELSSPGVDGHRWRTTSRQHSPFIMETLTDVETYAAGITLARQHRQAKGGIGNISITLAGTPYAVTNLHVLDAVSRVQVGRVIGGGASATSAAAVLTTWSLVRMDTFFL